MRKEKIQRNRGVRAMSQTHHYILGHRILLQPSLIDIKTLTKQGIEQFGASRQVCEHEQVNIFCCPKTAQALTASAPTRQYEVGSGSAVTTVCR